MPRVFIPPLLQRFTSGEDFVEIEGSTVREVVQNLEVEYPGIRDRICQEDRINPGIAVAVDGQISNEGMRRKVGPDSELQFIPAIGGG
ncbi:MAG: hypothetical protein DF168_00187 [Candidatus Moanabacter tarae]|uniref:Sulfur carrier protein CysO n=1 Tax=Candidatus Moanibacter tarae TaxID=2200854 RepID=A0A2Z4AG24_9BACT|nr:MAG: hypothetical protein DF168_00187 [Candidatus Moanabacter tarae]|tara:strand:- start:1910 stop:2173 length:264 start_codon:yes stop_codon:yes gene_type:complete